MKDYYDKERKANWLISEIGQLRHCTNPSSPQYASIRSVISAELLGNEHLEIATRALGDLDEEGAIRLLKIIEHCSETFYYSSSVLSAIALPMAVLWRSPKEHGYRLTRVNRDAINGLGHALAQRDGIRRVVFDTRPFSNAEVFSTSARDLREYLWHLNASTQVAWDHPASLAVHSQADPMWQMVYFLGLEVSDPAAPRTLMGNELSVNLRGGQSSFMNLVRSALVDSNHFHSYCPGVWYLHDGLRQGEKTLRRRRLLALMEAVHGANPNNSPIQVIYSTGPLSQTMDLIASKGWLHIAGAWKPFPEEGLNDFVQELILVAEKISNADIELKFKLLEWSEFSKIKRSWGIVHSLGMAK